MRFSGLLSVVALASVALTSCAHRSASSNSRSLTVSASESVTVEPDLAILHIGFDTPSEDLKSAHSDGARRSTAIIAAVKQAGIPESAIRSEWQNIDRVWIDEHKFRVSQQWFVKVPPERAAEILDIAISAGANSSGQIEWTVTDEKSLENQALDHASSRAKENAAVLAKGMGVHLGSLVSVSNQVSAPQFPMQQMNVMQAAKMASQLAIEPHQVSRQATVYAVFAIE